MTLALQLSVQPRMPSPAPRCPSPSGWREWRAYIIGITSLSTLVLILAFAQPSVAQSCGQAGGNYCSQSGSCPAGYSSLGQTWDCNPCCLQGPSCGALGGNWCSGTGSCPGGYSSLGRTYDCNPCCKQQNQSQMNFSVHTDTGYTQGWVYGNSSVIDLSWGCNHSNYATRTTIYSPSGRSSPAQCSGLQCGASMAVSGEYGTYTVVTTGTYNCSCLNWGPASFGSTEHFYVSVPADLHSIPPDQYSYSGLGDYLRTRLWQIYNQYSQPWTYSDLLTESYTPIPGLNECNIAINTGTAYSDGQGRFTDRYGNYPWHANPVPACFFDSLCQSTFTQTISVWGVPFSHQVTFGCYDAWIARQ